MFDRFAAPRVSLTLAAGVVVLLAILATMQYRWLGQVAEAERARLQAGARTRVEGFADDFDREITRAYAWLRVDAEMLGEGGGARYAARYERWSARTEYAGLVAAVYVAEYDEGTAGLRRFDPSARDFAAASWPADLEPLRRAVESGGPGPRNSDRGGPRPPFRFVIGDMPALVIPIPAGADGERRGERFEDPPGAPRVLRERWSDPGGGFPLPPGRGFPTRPPRGLTVVVLDRAYLGRELLPALAARHFARHEGSEYAVVVTTRRDPRTVVYRSDGVPDGHTADATATLFEVRFDEIESGTHRAGDPALPPPMAQRAPPGDGRRPFAGGFGPRRGPHGRPEHGLWEAKVVHRGGPLEQVVAHVRRRNLAISFGILVLLGASVALIVSSSQRARRLAEQQVEFVAGVSHELRTPVAVVVSAGENLADGVVRDAAEVRLYGTTIRDEGRRLAEMVEQVLEFAGITSRERLRAREPVRLPAVVRDAIEASRMTLAEAGVELAVDVPEGLPAVVGDRAALRRAVQNLIQNAARHAASGRWIGIAAKPGVSRRGDVVRLTVRDRGHGIAPADQPRLFEPFFRGRRALAAGITGSGLGLSLVKSIVEAHGGSVEMETAAGAGTAFTLVLPAAPPDRASATSAEERNAQADPAG